MDGKKAQLDSIRREREDLLQQIQACLESIERPQELIRRTDKMPATVGQNPTN
jgi:hypothetical protein